MAKGKRVFNRLVRGVRGNLISDRWERKFFNLRHDFPDEFARDGSTVTLSNLGLSMPVNSFGFLLDNYPLARDLRRIGARFFTENGKLFIDIRGVVLNPTTAEEVFITHEIFFKGIYNFVFPRKCIVVDVGMNVGIASLFFSSLDNVLKVYSFEPFLPTFEHAKYNLSLNEKLSQNIVPQNIGLGSRSETLVVDYDYANKGQAGVGGTTFIRSELEEVERQTIVLKDTAPVMRELLNRHPDTAFALKLDCEGSEYEIVRNLLEHNLLGLFSIVFIEWHQQGPETLLTSLRSSGFTSFFQHTSETIGVIYATK